MTPTNGADGSRGRLLLRAALSLVGASLAVALVWTTMREQPGPGPLSSVHAGQPALMGVEGCAACHGTGPGVASMAAACGACHGDVLTAISARRGFHGTVDDAIDCARCHREHLGDGHPLIGDLAFQMAGHAAMDAYDHRGLGLELAGRHERLECAACHPNAAAVTPGSPRFAPIDPSCTSCHSDEHAGALGDDCAQCHGQSEPFAVAPGFRHTERFALSGAHAGVACARCHEPESATGSPGLGPSFEGTRGCADCHGSPHSETESGAERACANCHAAVAGGFASATRTLGAPLAELHMAHGLPLEQAHARVDCGTCHAAGLPFEARHPGGRAERCDACHVSPHGSQFGGGVAGTRCSECHGSTRFDELILASVDVHRRAGWSLEGAHQAVPCAACHVPSDADGVVRYRGTPRACAACHADVHGAALDPPVDAYDEGCAHCHRATAFHDLTRPFEHGRATTFDLVGAHAELDCRECHPPGGVRLAKEWSAESASPRRSRCDECHADPHDGRFDRPDLPARVGDRVGCARCHSEVSFAAASGGFDHGVWTGFALSGAHAQAACSECHPAPGGDGEERAATHTACASCHEDPHGRSFPALAGSLRSDCGTCHSTASFRAVEGFDHAVTGWPLAGVHARTDCHECHGPARGRERRAVARTCGGCHADPHAGQFSRRTDDVLRRETDCSTCHAAAATAFDELTFDHGATRFPLADAHARLACDACHVPARTHTGRRVVRYRPLGHECRDCHGPVRAGDRTEEGAAGGVPR